MGKEFFFSFSSFLISKLIIVLLLLLLLLNSLIKFLEILNSLLLWLSILLLQVFFLLLIDLNSISISFSFVLIGESVFKVFDLQEWWIWSKESLLILSVLIVLVFGLVEVSKVLLILLKSQFFSKIFL